MALDTEGLSEPTVSLPAGGVDGGGGESGDPTMADMEAIMASERAIEDAAGADVISSDVDGGSKPGDRAMDYSGDRPKPVEPAKAEGDAAVPPAAVDPAPTEPVTPEPVTPAPDAALVAERSKLRKEHIRIANERAAVVQKAAEANAVLERAKAFEADANEWRTIRDKVKADPIGFVLKHGDLGEGDEGVQRLLDRVIEREKSPAEKEALDAKSEVQRLRDEITAKEAKATKDAEERAVREVEERNARALSVWHDENVSFAKSNPDKYDLINTLDLGEVVHQTAVAYFELHKALAPREYIADQVEARYRENAKKSKYIQSLSAASKPAVAPPAKAAQSSNGTPAPKQSGARTLTSVPSGSDNAHREAPLPEDSNDRLNAVFAEMAAAGEL
jgi:hypothetical protein